MTAALVALMLVVRGVVAWLRQQGQLTGELSEDRRRVLAALGGLGLAGLFGAHGDAAEPLLLRPVGGAGRWLRIGPPPERVATACWFIDPLLGSDSNDGRSATTPLRTHASLQARKPHEEAAYRSAPVHLLIEGE